MSLEDFSVHGWRVSREFCVWMEYAMNFLFIELDSIDADEDILCAVAECFPNVSTLCLRGVMGHVNATTLPRRLKALSMRQCTHFRGFTDWRQVHLSSQCMDLLSLTRFSSSLG